MLEQESESRAWQYRDAIYNYLWRKLRSHEDAQDAMQDVMLKVWMAEERCYQEKGCYFSWLIRVARNTAVDYCRKRNTLIQFSDLHDVGYEMDRVLIDPSTPESLLMAQEEQERRRALVQQLLVPLAPNHQSFMVVYLNWLRQDETNPNADSPCLVRLAETLGLNYNTVKIHLHRAKRHMARIAQESGITLET